MKTNNRWNPYVKLSHSIFKRAAIATGIAVILVIGLRVVTRGHLADRIVELISVIFRIDLEYARYVYFMTFSNSMEFIIGIIILLFMLVLFGIFLRSYREYFEEVVIGIEQLSIGKPERITLSPELEAVERTLNSVRDELARQKEQVRIEEQKKNELVVYLAHDIKTPLTSVIGYLSLLQDHQNLPEDVKSKYLNIAAEKAQRLNTLVNDFFEITRYTLLSPPLDKSDVDLCYMFVQLSDELHPLAASLGKTVRNTVNENTIVCADPERIARAFNNVLKNAITYSQENSDILIAADANENAVTVHISNDGMIPSEQCQFLFDKFYRGNAARTSDTGGSGLGLAIAKSIVELHGGTISVKCAEGKTTFSLTLPKHS